MEETLQQPLLPVVQRALALQPFKATTTRRNLATALRAFTAAWTALDQVQVLSNSTRRLGERAAAVLIEVYEVVKQVDEVERAAMGDKVVLERSYEFRKEGSEDGAGQAGQGGVTKTKIQTTMLDLQMFATDYLALSTTSRLSLLVDGLPEQQRKLRTLTASLCACLSTYSLSSPSASSWADEDTDDLATDEAALPRLFQLSLALRGPVYDAFLASQPASLAQDPPAKRRAAFVEWCYGRNPLLRPKEGSPSPSAIRCGKPKVSWPPAQGETTIPSGLTAPASPTPRRVVSQPLPASASSSPSPPPPATPPQLASPVIAPTAEEALSASLSPLSVPEPALEIVERDESVVEPARAVVSVEKDEPPSGSSVEQQGLEDTSATSGAPDVLSDVLSASSSTAAGAAQAVADPSSSPPPLVTSNTSSIPLPPSPVDPAPTEHEVGHSIPVSSTSPTKPSSPPSSPSLALPPANNPDPLLSLGRRDSSASSVAMTVTGSAGSRLFEPEGAVEEEEEVGEEDPAEQAKVDEPTIDVENASSSAITEPMLEEEYVESKMAEDEAVEAKPTEDGQPDQPAAETEEGQDAPAETPSTPVFALTVESAVEENIKPVEPAATGGEKSGAEKSHADGETLPAPILISAHESAPKEELRSAPTPVNPAASPPTPAKELPSLSIPPSAPLRILSLDGGGLVGPIQQLLLLQQHLSSLLSSPSPAQHFDLIVGTSSSALLAVLLGHLGLGVDAALELYTRIAQKAFELELPSLPAPHKAAKKGIWSRLFGLGGSSSSPPPSTSSSTGPPDAVRREKALDEALKAFLPQANKPFSRSSSTKSKSRVAVLAYERINGATQEVWLWTDDAASHGLTVSEVIKASLAASSFFPPSSRFTRSPTSLNPSTAALSLVRSSSLALAGRPVSLLSLSTGYSSLSPDLLSSKRLSKSRLSALREVKQLAASNAVAAAALAAKVKREAGVEVRRVEVDCSGCAIEAREEWQSVEAVKKAVQAGSGSGKSTPRPAASPSLPSSPVLLSPTPTNDSPSKPSLKKRASRLSFFGSLGSNKSPSPPPSRRATSFLPSSSSSINLSPPISPVPTTPAPSSPSLLAPPDPEPRRLRTSVSLGDMGRQECATAVSGNGGGRGAMGMYGVKEAVGSVGSLGERRA